MLKPNFLIAALKSVTDLKLFFQACNSFYIIDNSKIKGESILTENESFFLQKLITEVNNYKRTSKLKNEETFIKVDTLIREAYTLFTIDFNFNINCSVLAGEYYFVLAEEVLMDKTDDISSTTQNFKNEVRELENEILKFKKNAEKFITIGEELRELVKWIREFIYLYGRLKHFVKAFLEFRSQEIHLITINESLVPKNIEFNKPFNLYYKIFSFNVEIAYIEDNLGVDDKLIYRLYKIKEQIAQIEFIIFHKEILIDKCEFLIKKIVRGYQRISEVVLFDDFSFDSRDEGIIDAGTFTITEFKYFENQLEGYYKDIEKFTLDASKIENRILQDDSNKVTYREIHYLSKAYLQTCSHTNSVWEKFTKLIKYFESTYKNEHGLSTELFQQQAYFTTQIFLQNRKVESIVNEFKIYLKTLSSDTEYLKAIDIYNNYTNKIEAFITEIRSNQIDGVRNYFLFYVACRFYYLQLRFLSIICGSKQFNFELIEHSITQFRDNYDLAKRNILWCDEMNFLQLYLPYEECLIQAKAKDEQSPTVFLMLDSAYLLPVDYKDRHIKLSRILDKFLDIRVSLINKIQSIRTLNISEAVAATENLQESSEKLNRDLIDLKEKTKPILQQSIQILGIFSGIIAFAFGSINTIPRFHCIEAIVIFLMVLGAVLIGFIYSINVIILQYGILEPEINSDQFKIREKRLHKFGRIILLILVSCGGASFFIDDCKIEDSASNSNLNNTINFEPVTSQSQKVIDSSKAAIFRKPVPKTITKQPCDTIYILKEK